jgi:hypothetical protein
MNSTNSQDKFVCLHAQCASRRLIIENYIGHAAQCVHVTPICRYEHLAPTGQQGKTAGSGSVPRRIRALASNWPSLILGDHSTDKLSLARWMGAEAERPQRGVDRRTNSTLCALRNQNGKNGRNSQLPNSILHVWLSMGYLIRIMSHARVKVNLREDQQKVTSCSLLRIEISYLI